MKKKILSFFIVFIFMFVLIIQTNAYADTHTLEEIAEVFNNSKQVQELQKNDLVLSSFVNEDEPTILLITIETPDGNTSLSYELNGSILSYDYLATFEQKLASNILVDSVGQVNGYKEGDLNETLNSEEIVNYTLEKEGLEIKEIAGGYTSVKMDINKKIPLVDLSDFYFKPEEFDIAKEYVEDGKSGNQSREYAKLSYNVEVNKEENSIYIGEEGQITERTYKSILSAIEAMYGEKVVQYFESKYPEIVDGLSELDGFTVQTDPETILNIFEDKKVVLVTFDNEFVNNNILNESNIILEKIAEIFNNCKLVTTYNNESPDYNLSAMTIENEPNILSVAITSKEGNTAISYELNGNILSYEHLVSEHMFPTFILADCVGQLNGYEDGELYETLNSEEIVNYTLENEGFELKKNESYYSVKMDITKKVPLVDLSEFYLQPEDFDFVKKIIDDNEVGNQTGKNKKMSYNIHISNEENEIYIGEENETTVSTYKSILSALEVMYGEKAVEYFESIYPEFIDGITELEGITVDANFETDENIFANSKVVLVKLNNEFINEVVLATEYIGETVDLGDKTITLDFTGNNSYIIKSSDTLESSGDLGILFMGILDPLCADSNVNLDDEIIYFNIKDGKLVLGDKDHSVFKCKINDDFSIEFLPTITDVENTTVVAKHENSKIQEYKKDAISESQFRYLKYNLTVNVIYGKATSYEVLEGANQKLNTYNETDLTFRFNIEFAKFQETGKVYVDNQLVDSANYTSKEGSTIITFNSEYTNKLSGGEHTLKVAVADGEVSTSFTVVNEKPVNNPKTGDNIIIYITLFIISLLGLVFIGYKKYTK